MKRYVSIFAIVLVVLIAGTVMLSAETAAMQMAVGTATAQPGETVTLQVQLTGNSGFSYLKITPSYDADALSLQTADNGEVSTDAFVTTSRALAWDSDQDATADGVLATLTFLVSADAPSGTYEVGLTVNECYNSGEQDVVVETISGAVIVQSETNPSQSDPITYGDVNNDERIDAKDALLALQKAVDKIDLNDREITAADVDASGKIDAKDALLILKRAVNKIKVFPVEQL